ncbi:amidophosphoribosyltransferase [Pelagibacteraceae bacterium]|nr:amidophosphoribosyltransferase [Pelagibacteraceae bacterium]
MDRLNEECGVFGIFNNKDAAPLTALGLHALQHRGQEGCGIISFDGNKFHAERRLGLVGDNFTKGKILNNLPGSYAIGHNRYSTSGNNLIKNVQPFFADLYEGGIGIAHNGNLSNAMHLRKELVKNGSIFQTTSDTETIVQLIAKSKRLKIIDKIIDALFKIQGGYALTILTNKQLIGVRDPFGIRPLVIGKVNKSYVLASETCALDIIDAKFVREVENGEIVIINDKGIESIKPFPKVKERPCIFEYIYFSRPDSIIKNRSVYEYRKKLGSELAKESNVNADLVVPVPDSGVPASIGFAEQIKKNVELGIIRNHYVGRTFIEPTQKIRSLGVKLKHNINKTLVQNKSIILIDDSLVRGTTSIKIIKMLYEAGAKEVHLRIASPPIKYPDYYGVDTPDKNELLASKFELEEMRKYINAKSLKFLSIQGLYKSMGFKERNESYPQFTDHCFTGDYPVKPIDAVDKDVSVDHLSFLSSKS